MEELIARIFALRNAAHLAHWAETGPGSFARHMALGDFYEALIAKADSVVEIYQGVFGLVGEVPTYDFDKKDILAQIEADARWIKARRTDIAKGDAVIENQLDELGALYAGTAYKLRFLS